MKQLILASGSPRRKELLERIGIPFTIEPSGYEEDMTLHQDPHKLVKHLSLGKAQDVAAKHSNAIVLGADTIIVDHNHILGKPHTEEKAREMLMRLSGKQHSVITGYTIIDCDTKRTISEAVETNVYFRNLSDEEINGYIKTNESLDVAGAYRIQGLGALLVEKIEGDYYNVIGFPLTSVALTLRTFGYKIFI